MYVCTCLVHACICVGPGTCTCVCGRARVCVCRPAARGGPVRRRRNASGRPSPSRSRVEQSRTRGPPGVQQPTPGSARRPPPVGPAPGVAPLRQRAGGAGVLASLGGGGLARAARRADWLRGVECKMAPGEL